MKSTRDNILAPSAELLFYLDAGLTGRVFLPEKLSRVRTSGAIRTVDDSLGLS